MKNKLIAAALFVACLLSGILAAQDMIPPLLPGELGITGKLRPQYLDSDNKLGKILDFSDVDEVPAGRVLLEQVKKSLTEAEVNGLATTPVELIAAPGANKVIVTHRAFFRFSTSDTDASSGTATISLRWKATSGNILLAGSRMGNLWPAITASPTRRVLIYPAANGPKDFVENAAIVVESNRALPTEVTTGEIIVFYQILDLSF